MVTPSYDVSPCANFGYEIINRSTIPIIVRKNGGLNCIIPGSTKPSYQNLYVLNIDIRIPNDNSIYFDLENITNPLDKEILTVLDGMVKKEMVHMAARQYYYLMNFQFSIVLNNDHADPETGEIISELFGFNITQQTNKSTEFVGKHYQAGHRAVINDAKAKSDPDTLVMSVKLVDNHNRFGSLWTQCLGEGRKVPTVCDDKIPEGLYYTCFLREGAIKKEFIPIENVNLEQLKPLGIYTDKIQADLGGNSKLKQKLNGDIETLTTERNKLKEAVEETSRKLLAALDNVEQQKKLNAIQKMERAVQESLHKVQAEITKHKQNSSSFGDFIKGMVNVVGLVFTGIRLFN